MEALLFNPELALHGDQNGEREHVDTSEARLITARLRRRSDLRFARVEFHSASKRAREHELRWNVFDPLTRQSYRVGIIEHWLLTRPDGALRTQDLLAALRRDLLCEAYSDQQLLQVVATLHRCGLLEARGLALPSRPKSRLQSWLGSVVVWQIRGVNPDRWLGSWAPHTGFLFSLAAVKFWSTSALLTFLAVLLDFPRLVEHTVIWQWITSPTQGGMLVGAFIATRAMHELGHALVCKRFGVRCPDIGFFLILGAPCVYCDVSECWQLPRRSQRAAVAAAGMYVELIIATIAAWVWLGTIDGPVNTFALQTMVVCSISTLVINANPLMRFDGYYILADCLNETSLRAKADALAGSCLRRVLIGAVETKRKLFARDWFFLSFSLAGWVYRALLSLTIASLLVSLYGEWKLAWVGKMLAVAVLVSWWGVPAMRFFNRLIQQASQWRSRARLAAICGFLLVVLCVVPFPSRQSATGWLQPLESHGVYAGSPSRLVNCTVSDGQRVAQDELLFQLSSEQLLDQRRKLQANVSVAAIQLEYQTRRRDMYQQNPALETYKHKLQDAELQLSRLQREIDRLQLRAPVSGKMVAVTPVTHAARKSSPPVVRSWCEPQQLGSKVPTGTLLGNVCSDRLLAVIPLTEQQLSQIAVGTPVRMRVNASRTLLGTTHVDSIVDMGDLQSRWRPQSNSAASPTSSDSSLVRFAAVVHLPAELDVTPGTGIDAVFTSQSISFADCAFKWLKANARLLAD